MQNFPNDDDGDVLRGLQRKGAGPSEVDLIVKTIISKNKI